MENDSHVLQTSAFSETLFVIFLRFAALVCLWLGLTYWAMLVGYSGAGADRFDLLITPWKVCVTILAVLFPVAALGLWLPASWGPVIWVIATGIQVVMHGFFADIFGVHGWLLMGHALTAVLYAAMRIWLHIQRKRQRNQAQIYLP